MSARLMMFAVRDPSRPAIICDRNTYDATRARIQFERPLEPIRVKGCTYLVDIYTPLDGIEDESVEGEALTSRSMGGFRSVSSVPFDIFGRKAELSQLIGILQVRIWSCRG